MLIARSLTRRHWNEEEKRERRERQRERERERERNRRAEEPVSSPVEDQEVANEIGVSAVRWHSRTSYHYLNDWRLSGP